MKASTEIEKNHVDLIVSSYVSRLRACGPEYPGYFCYGRSGSSRSTGRVVTALSPLQWWILFLFVGQACTNLTGRWRALFARYFLLLGCWPSGFPNNTTRIITKPGDRHWFDYGPGHGYSGERRCKGKQRVCFIDKESVEVPGMGPGESYTGVFGKVHTARWLLVKRPWIQAGGCI